MIKFFIICARLYLAGFRISRSEFESGNCGLHRFYWDYGNKKVEVLDMPDLDWYVGKDGKNYYSLIYNGHMTKITGAK